MTLLRLLFAALTILLRACASQAVPADPTPHQSYFLIPAQRADLGGHATLVYDSFSDSRCPAKVQCIWAGELVYRFVLRTPTTTESFALSPKQPVYVSQALNGARISIDAAKLPAPPQPGVAQLPYPVTLTVTRP
jgi:hypothetical protein